MVPDGLDEYPAPAARPGCRGGAVGTYAAGASIKSASTDGGTAHRFLLDSSHRRATESTTTGRTNVSAVDHSWPTTRATNGQRRLIGTSQMLRRSASTLSGSALAA